MRAYCHFACGKVFTITGSGVTRIRQHLTRMEKGGEVSFCTAIGPAELAKGISLGIPGFKAKREWLLTRDSTEEVAPKRRKTSSTVLELETLLQACKDICCCLSLFSASVRTQSMRHAAETSRARARSEQVVGRHKQ